MAGLSPKAQRALDKYKARIAAIPPKAVARAKEGLHAVADDLVKAMKAAAPVSPLEKRAGEFRDSIHWETSRRKDLAVVIIADPKDEHGHGYAPHVEHGHRAADGSHVAAQPTFFPTYRANKKRMRAKLTAAARKAFKEV